MLTPYRRGLLLVYGCTVFGDTKESVDEVNSPRFFYCLNSKLWTNTNSIIYNKKTITMKKFIMILCIAMISIVASAQTPIASYQFTDKDNKTWVLTINREESANLKCVKSNEVYYGSWWDASNINIGIDINFEYDDCPEMRFSSTELRKQTTLNIKDGYVYETSDAAKANNPRKRLPIKSSK